MLFKTRLDVNSSCAILLIRNFMNTQHSRGVCACFGIFSLEVPKIKKLLRHFFQNILRDEDLSQSLCISIKTRTVSRPKKIFKRRYTRPKKIFMRRYTQHQSQAEC